ncbi:MAG TPA: ABC transporter ATP-binding protein [bacterium]|nr:ABC transporter ATP-binding protein [bacterium]
MLRELLLTEKKPVTDTSRKAGKRLMSQTWMHKKPVLVGIVCSVIATALYSSTPLFIKLIIDAIENRDLKKSGLIASLIVVVFAVRWLIAYLNSYMITLGGMRLVEDLRNMAYSKIQSMSFGFFEKRQAGELMSRIQNDTGVVQMFVTSGISEMVRVPIGVIAALSIVIYLSATLTILSLLLLPLIAVVISVGGKRMKKHSLLLQEKVADFNASIYETIGLIHVVKMFSMEDHEIRKYAKENRDTVNATMRQVKVRASYSPMVEFLGAACLAIMLYIGAYFIVHDIHDPITGKLLTLGSVMALFVGLQQIFTQINHVNSLNLTLQHAFAAAERIYEVIDMPVDIEDKPDAIDMPEIKGDISLEDVSFHYKPGEPVLHGLNLRIEPGSVVALVGPSGSGKSTIAKLLPRFYDVTEGRITIEGVDIRDAKIVSYRKHIGIVPQETLLFRDTIKNNIAYGRMGASDEEIMNAATAAYAHDFIMEMPDGYDTMVGERGITLSGGQRQRIAIARAILMNPKILILDEATSSVDNISEVYIQRALEKLMKTRTTIVIAHRLTTIRNADRIAVLEAGRIVELGKHDELYEAGGAYRRLYDLTLEASGVAENEPPMEA